MSNIIIPEAYTKTFSKNFTHQAQKKQARFKMYACVKAGSGEVFTDNTIAPEEMEETTGQRMPKTVLGEIGGEIRNCFPRKFRRAIGQDQYDEALLGQTVLPGSDILTAISMAYERQCDSVFLDGIVGDNKVGANGGVVETLHADNIVPVDYVRTGNDVVSNLTTEKIRYIKRGFEQSEFYGQGNKMAGSKICMAINASMKDAILDDDLVSDADKSRINKWDDGDLLYWNGIHFIRDEELPTDPTNPNIVSAVAWVSTEVCFAPWKELRTRISEREDLDYGIQYYASGMMGAYRRQQRAVYTAACQTDLY